MTRFYFLYTGVQLGGGPGRSGVPKKCHLGPSLRGPNVSPCRNAWGCPGVPTAGSGPVPWALSEAQTHVWGRPFGTHFRRVGTTPPDAHFENGKTRNGVACNHVWDPQTISFVMVFGAQAWLHATSFSVCQFFFRRARDLLGPPLGRVDMLLGAVLFRVPLSPVATPVQQLAPAGLPGLPHAVRRQRRPLLLSP